MDRLKLTIFTPTYNRQNLITRIYDSILRNNYYDKIEWLIIDDGSTDNTESVINELKTKSLFEINYFKKENGGKPSAFNLGITKAKGDLFVCIDDDDFLTDNAIESIFELNEKINGDPSLCGFVGKCIDKNGNLLGNNLATCFLVSDTIEIRDKYKFWGEPEIYRIDLLKQNLFPIIENEKFITEAIVFDKITSCQKLLYTNVPMMVKEFFSGGLTDNQLKIRVNNPIGTRMYYEQRTFLSKIFKARLKSAINYIRFSFHAKKKKFIKGRFFLSLVSFLAGYIMYKNDKKKLRRGK